MDSQYLILLLALACLVICEGKAIKETKQSGSDVSVNPSIKLKEPTSTKKEVAENTDLTHKVESILEKNLVSMLSNDALQILSLLWNERDTFIGN